MQLRWQLQTLREKLSINEHISRGKNLFNRLSAVGEQMNLREQIMYLVNGLNFDYSS